MWIKCNEMLAFFRFGGFLRGEVGFFCFVLFSLNIEEVSQKEF